MIGCASTVKKAVTALPTVESVETSVEKQTVMVKVEDDLTFDQVKLAIQNAGKRVNGGRVVDGEAVTEMPVEASQVIN